MITDEDVEIVARRMCEHMGVDPDMPVTCVRADTMLARERPTHRVVLHPVHLPGMLDTGAGGYQPQIYQAPALQAHILDAWTETINVLRWRSLVRVAEEQLAGALASRDWLVLK